MTRRPDEPAQSAAGPSGLPRHVDVRGVRVPTLIYGTAWKENATARLTRMALAAGFRGIDTANQRRHYFEAGVGEALRDGFAAGPISRGDLFLQTKFTYLNGQDHRRPYDPRAPLSTQVEQSFASSLEHLGVDHLDAYLLHGPSTPTGLAQEDWETWRAMEALQRAGRTKLIGVSNVTAGQLEALWADASVKPAIVQNRCFTRPEADRAVRRFCKNHGIAYQGFSFLTASRALLQHSLVLDVAARRGLTPPQVVFWIALHEGMVVLTGTTSAEHIAQDFAVYDVQLAPDDVREIERLIP